MPDVSKESAAQYDQTTYRAAIESEQLRTLYCCVATVFCFLIAAVVAGVTYFCVSPGHPSQKQMARMECLQHGSSWLPVITVWSESNTSPQFSTKMACVLAGDTQTVLSQNTMLLQKANSR